MRLNDIVILFYVFKIQTQEIFRKLLRQIFDSDTPSLIKMSFYHCKTFLPSQHSNICEADPRGPISIFPG